MKRSRTGAVFGMAAVRVTGRALSCNGAASGTNALCDGFFIRTHRESALDGFFDTDAGLVEPLAPALDAMSRQEAAGQAESAHLCRE